MPKRFKFIIAIISAFTIALLALIIISKPNKTTTYNFARHEIRLIIADSPATRTRGLSGWGLDDFSANYDGMLFVFPDYEERNFWMKGMKFPLDIIWLRDGKIMKMERNIEIFDESGQVNRMNSMPFQVNQVLEMPAGKIDEYGFIIGHILEDLY